MSKQEVTRRYQVSLATANTLDRTRVHSHCACCFGRNAADPNEFDDKLTLNSSGNSNYRYTRHAQCFDDYMEADQNGGAVSYFDTSLPETARTRLTKPKMRAQKRLF